MKAFPNGIITNGDGLIIGGQQGMDLRDWFAGLAMEGIVYEGDTPEQTAKAAYQMADAMMKEREINNGQN